MKVTGKIEITYQKDKKFIYQTIRIVPNKNSNSGYFNKDKYRLGRFIDDFLSKVYIGDGVNIVHAFNAPILIGHQHSRSTVMALVE